MLNDDINDLVWFDTETTGLGLRQGSKPFFLVLQSPKKGPTYFEFDVDPFTRDPIIPPEDIEDIKARFRNKKAIGFNTKYDLLALEVIGINLWDIVGWENIHDVQLMAHAYQSGGSQGLKELCVRHLGILDNDEKILGKITNQARAKARRLKWAIAHPDHPHFKFSKRFDSKKSPAWKADMWLPRAIAQHENRPETDPWWTVLRDYAVTDGKRTMDLFLLLRDRLWKEGLWEQYELNRRLLQITYESEARGLSMIPSKVRTEKLRMQKGAKVYANAAKAAIGNPDINLRSADQLRALLYEDYQLPVLGLSKKSGKPSTEAEVLVRLLPESPPEIQKFITNLIISKKFTKGAENLDKFSGYLLKGKVHCNNRITGTKVTRMSVVDPPLQTVSKNLGAKEHWPDELKQALIDAGVTLRTVFGPEPGWEWYALDLVQAHPRIFAWMSNDQEAQAVFNEGKDYYKHLAAGALKVTVDEVTSPQRSLFKMVNLADMYGVGDAKLEKNTGMPGLKQLLAETFPSRALFLGKIKDSAQGKGYVTTACGYRLYCPDSHKLTNYVIIGTEGRIMKQAMIYCYDYLQSIQTPLYRPYIALQVHDELLFAFPTRDRERNLGHVKQLATLMEKSGWDHGVNCPVDASLIPSGSSWATPQKLDLKGI